MNPSEQQRELFPSKIPPSALCALIAERFFKLGQQSKEKEIHSVETILKRGPDNLNELEIRYLTKEGGSADQT
ncbi:MAG: hypothetical protein KDD40_00890 [Bdellovibrionales bacterium]|nr:hypothetical protein [Bdellovibrionales bacterium]